MYILLKMHFLTKISSSLSINQSIDLSFIKYVMLTKTAISTNDCLD